MGVFVIIESGKKGAEMFEKLMEQLGGGQFVELQQAIHKKELTAQQVDALRDKIKTEMEALLGPWSALLVDIPFLSYVENKVADWVLGEESEALRQAIVDFEFPEDAFENLCEDQ